MIHIDRLDSKPIATKLGDRRLNMTASPSPVGCEEQQLAALGGDILSLLASFFEVANRGNAEDRNREPQHDKQ